ncbi:MAG TPA: cohesin domain-containing protein [Thermoanaerobaculia bacterium]|nr:cohesin domain-containing protein [Thermoanaerobaculia bacterium]
MRNSILRAIVGRSALLISLVALLLVAGCTSNQSYRKAETAAQRGDWDAAVLQYMKAVDQDPGDITYRAALMRAKTKASQVHFAKGQEFEKAGVTERALVEYQQAVQLDPTNQYAKARLERVHQAYLAQRQNRATGSIDQLKKKAQQDRPQPPVLNPRSTQPISLEFPEPVSIFQIYKALGKAFGINILFDPNLKDQEIAIDLKDVTAQTALETLMRSVNHFYKVLDDHTVLIAADTPQNRRIYEDLVIQTFFLSNSEVKEMMTILRSLVDSKKIAVNEQLNAIILRDTADRVKVAEKIIETNDKAKAEVVVDVELLQINTARLRDLGVNLSQYSISQTLDRDPTKNPLRISDLQFLNQGDWILTLPSFVYNFVKNNTDAQLLAKPQLRITEGEKANLVIGDRVPIPLTTFNTQNAGTAGGIVPITSFQYQDVGIKIEIDPRVHHNQEVTMHVKIEVSNINGYADAGNGQKQPIIGTRTIDSVIRLQDGETNFIAGLIRTDETNTDSGVPGLSEIPLIGRLFADKRTDHQRTDVILTLTPHIIRNAEITEEDLKPIWVGTDANMTFRGSPRVDSEIEGPFDTNEGTPEEIQDAIRRRLQRLPRGLQPGVEMQPPPMGGVFGNPNNPAPGQQPNQPGQPPAGVNLVPAAPPSDIFRPATPQPPPQQQPQQQQQVPEEETEPPPASGTAHAAALAPGVPVNPRGQLGSLLTERSAEAGGGEDKRGVAVRLWLTPDRTQVAAGDHLTVAVQVSAQREISHLPLTLTYDPALLAFEAAAAGDFLGAPGTAQVMADASTPGTLVLGASRLGSAPGVSGEGTVAVLTFRALAAGASRIAFDKPKALDAALHPVLPLRTLPLTVETSGRQPRREV